MKRTNETEKKLGKNPSFPLYAADLFLELSGLSNEAAGAWIKILCTVHFSPRRGYLEFANGEPYQAADIAHLIGETPITCNKILAEMERKGTFSRDERGCIYNRRMARDTKISEVRRQAVSSRSDRQLKDACSDFVASKRPTNEVQNRPSSSSSSSSPLIPPHAPPPGGVPADAVPNTKRTRTRRQDSGVAPVADGDAKYRLPNGSLDYDAMERDFQAKRQASGKNGVPA